MFVQVFPCRCTEKLKQTFWPTQSYGFSSSHVWMCELDHKEAWALKNWCFWIVVLEKTLVSWTARSHQSNLKEINPVFIGRTDAEAKAPILWPPDARSWLIRKDPDAGKDGRLVEKGMTEDEMVGWHHWLNAHEFEQAPGDGEGQEARCAAVHGVTKSWTRLSDSTTTTTILLILQNNYKQ